MSRRALGIALALSLALNTSAIAALVFSRWSAAAHGHTMGGATQASVTQQLGLSPEQVLQVEAAQQEFVREAAPLRAEVQSNNSQLASVAISGGADAALTSRLLDESAALHRQIQALALVYLRREAAMLTPPQQAKLSHAIKTYIRSGACPYGSGAGMGLRVLGDPPKTGR
jgi:Spy/CpxP family protein refolding chaperone